MYIDRLAQESAVELLYWAAAIEADMKREASWIDWTGNARQTLNAFVIADDDTVMLVAKQQMFYGVSLELDHGGRYTIVMPTLQRYYPQVWAGISRMLGN